MNLSPSFTLPLLVSSGCHCSHCEATFPSTAPLSPPPPPPSICLPFCCSLPSFLKLAPGPSEPRRVPQTVHCLGNAVQPAAPRHLLHRPPPSFSSRLAGEAGLAGVGLSGVEGHWVFFWFFFFSGSNMTHCRTWSRTADQAEPAWH